MKEEFEDTKWVIIVGKSKKDRQHNDQKIKNKRTNNVLQNMHIKDQITRTPLKQGVTSGLRMDKQFLLY
jgi:hypothetical protein